MNNFSDHRGRTKKRWICVVCLGFILQLVTLVGAGAVLAQDSRGLRNPFSLPDGIMLSKDLVTETASVQPRMDLTLNAITRIGSKKIASINQQNFSLGEQVYGMQMVEIGREHVVLETVEGQVILNLGRPAFPIKVSASH